MEDFKDISVGDLLIQQVPDPLNLTETVNRRGIIILVSKGITTIEWMPDVTSSKYEKITIGTSSLRKMIMNGYIGYYPVGKPVFAA